MLLVAAACTGTPLRPSQPTNRPCNAWRLHAFLAARALLGAAMMICYYRAVSLVSIKNATALFFTSPMFTLILDHLRLVSGCNTPQGDTRSHTLHSLSFTHTHLGITLYRYHFVCVSAELLISASRTPRSEGDKGLSEGFKRNLGC